MATTPTYFGTACYGRVSFSATNTARDGTGTLQALTWIGTGGTAPTTDWNLKRVRIAETGDLADCIVTAFSTDASAATPLLFDDYDLGNLAASSTVIGGSGVAGQSGPAIEVIYNDIVFPGGCDLKFTLSVAPTSGNVMVTVFAERA